MVMSFKSGVKDAKIDKTTAETPASQIMISHVTNCYTI